MLLTRRPASGPPSPSRYSVLPGLRRGGCRGGSTPQVTGSAAAPSRCSVLPGPRGRWRRARVAGRRAPSHTRRALAPSSRHPPVGAHQASIGSRNPPARPPTHPHHRIPPGGPLSRKVDAGGAHPGGCLAGGRVQRGTQQAPRLGALHRHHHRPRRQAAAVCEPHRGAAAAAAAGHCRCRGVEADGRGRQARRQLVCHCADAVGGQAVLACG